MSPEPLAIMTPETPVHQGMWQCDAGGSAGDWGSRSRRGRAHDAAEIEHVITSFAQKPNGGLIALLHALTVFNAISDHRSHAGGIECPSIHALAEAAAAGGLVSYRINWGMINFVT